MNVCEFPFILYNGAILFSFLAFVYGITLAITYDTLVHTHNGTILMKLFVGSTGLALFLWTMRTIILESTCL